MIVINSNTIDILKNFSEINQSLLFRQGQMLMTISEQKNVLALANIEEVIPQTFAIYDLNKFLGVLSLFTDPRLTFSEKSVNIVSSRDANNFTAGDQNAEYMFADPSMIMKPPEKPIDMPSNDAEFILEEKYYSAIMKAAMIMNLPEICVEAKNDRLSMKAIDSKASIDSYSVDLGETDKELKVIFKIENMKMMRGSYDVIISNKGLGHFKNKHRDLEYWVATEKTS